MKRAHRLLGSLGILAALGGTGVAAERMATGRALPPAAATVTISESAPLFTATGLTGGEVLERCTVLTNEGPQPADVTLFGTAALADLSPWLELELVRGSLPATSTGGSCSGFAPDATDWGLGQPGLVFQGTLATLPDADAGIADPTRWEVGESHAYLLRVRFTGGDAQQGLATTQSFSWGVTPFDDRPPEVPATPTPDAPAPAPGTPQPAPGAPAPAPGADGSAAPLPDDGSGVGAGSDTTLLAGPGADGAGGLEQKSAPAAAGTPCTVVSFPTRAFIGARATKIRRIKKGTRAAADREAMLAELGSSSAEVVAAGEDVTTVSRGELARRARLLAATRKRKTVFVVRLRPMKDGTLELRMALRKKDRLLAPKRWRWVRYRLNGSATKSTLKYPYTATASFKQLRAGYNQIDLTLHRGSKGNRPRGTKPLLRRSYAFSVKASKRTTGGGSAISCTLG